MAGPLPAEKMPLRRGGKPSHSFIDASRVARPARRQAEQPPAQPPRQAADEAAHVAAGDQQRLTDHAGVFGVVGGHAATEEKMVAVPAREQLPLPSRRQVLGAQPQRIADGGPQQTPDNSFLGQHRSARLADAKVHAGRLVAGFQVERHREVRGDPQRERWQGLAQRERGRPDLELLPFLFAANSPVGDGGEPDSGAAPAATPSSARIAAFRSARRVVTVSTTTTLLPCCR